MRLILPGVAWLTGLYLGMSGPSPPGWLMLAAGAGAMAFLAVTRRFKALLVISACLILAGLGMWRGQAAGEEPGENISELNGRGSIEFTGFIAGDPEVGDRQIRFVVEAEQVSYRGRTAPASGRVLVGTARLQPRGMSREFPYYHYQDTVKVRGRLEAPENPEGFDYRGYLEKKGIRSQVRFPERVTVVSAGNSPALSAIYRLRASLSRSLGALLPEPEGSLARGILLGIRTGIPRELSNAFAATGTTHVLAISGQNLTIIAGLVMSLGVWLMGRRRQLYLALPAATIWFYAILTGFVPSVVRASVMATVFLAAHFLGRPRSGGPATVFAAGLMAAWQPNILTDTGFQLSFLAILGLIYLAPQLRSAFGGFIGEDDGRWRPALRLVADGVAVTLAATLFTLPVIAFNFQTVSLVSIPATLLLLPVLPAIILLSGATGLMGLLLPEVAGVMAWVAWLPLSYMVTVVSLFDRLPLAAFKIGATGAGMVWGYYLLLAFSIWLAGRPGMAARGIRALASKLRPAAALPGPGAVFAATKKWLVAVLLVAGSLIWLAFVSAPDGRLHLTFFEGGVLVRTPSGATVLIDGGPSPDRLNVALGRTLPFQQRGIDLVMVTSPQASQLGGLIDVLRNYRVDRILEPEPALSSGGGSATYLEWRREVKKQGLPSTSAVAGQVVDLGRGYQLQVLAVPEPAAATRRRSPLPAPSLVVRIEAGEISFLLSFPPEKERLEELAGRRVRLRSTVLRESRAGQPARTGSACLQVRLDGSTGFFNPVLPDAFLSSAAGGFGKAGPFSKTAAKIASAARTKKGL